MARTNTTYTASPTRFRSPQRSPARGPSSADGSQYEMDLDALGLNSTFDSTGLDESHEPKLDVVDTSDIEGPEDFTMNMTYWMTADLPIAQIKSRKEAHTNITEIRGDANVMITAQDTTEEGDKAIIEESLRTQEHVEEFSPTSPTMRANGTTEEQSNSTPPSERSMEHDEKVRSFLSALPDTSDLDDGLVSTPMRMNKQNLLQVPNSSAPRARSLQPTVEDYDTPRKPTQETVIHHAPVPATAVIVPPDHDSLRDQIAALQSRLEQQELASKTRITELETLLSYTRSDLEATRKDNYKHKEEIMSLKQEIDSHKKEDDVSHLSIESKLAAQEQEHNARMQDLGEELRLQNLAKLRSQREDFDHQLKNLEEAKRSVDEEVEKRGQLLQKIESELAQLRNANEQELQGIRKTSTEKTKSDEAFAQERARLHEKFSSLQARADDLQAELEKATSEAQIAREETEKTASLHALAVTEKETHMSRIADLEARLSSARAEVAEKTQLAQKNEELEFRLENLQSQLRASQSDASVADQTSMRIKELESRLESLHNQLQSAHTDIATKDQDMYRHIDEQEQSERRLHTAYGRVEGLEKTVSTLRQQLAEAHRDSAKTRTDVERLEKDLDDANDRLQESRIEADRRVADVEKKLTTTKELKAEAENKYKELQSKHSDLIEDHQNKLEDVRDKAEDAVRKAGTLIEKERTEKKKVLKEFKKLSDELRSEAAQKAAMEESSSDESAASLSLSHVNAKDSEIENLRLLVRKQAATLKTLKSEATSLRKERNQLKSTEADSTTIASLEAQIATIRNENSVLKSQLSSQQEEFEAVNKAMDERLATMMSKVLKDRAKTVVGKRDGQWKESMSKARDERELMGKVLLREWGRQEVGVADEEKGERQGYRYQYLKRC